MRTREMINFALRLEADRRHVDKNGALDPPRGELHESL